MDTFTAQPEMLSLQVSDSSEMATWSESKKKDYVDIFKKRAAAARYIYYKASEIIIERARSKRYISNKHYSAHNDKYEPDYSDLFGTKKQYEWGPTLGGRPVEELNALAEKRAKELLDGLPSVRNAMKIIQPDVARKMDKRDALRSEGQELFDKLPALSKPIAMSDCPDDMTLKEFRERVLELETQRDDILKQLALIGRQGLKLEDDINKALFEGVPELAEAVLKVAKEHYERGLFFGQATRRVEEHVLFGDSKAAMEILHHFEKDEVEVSSAIKLEFTGALERLKLLGAKGKKSKDESKESE